MAQRVHRTQRSAWETWISHASFTIRRKRGALMGAVCLTRAAPRRNPIHREPGYPVIRHQGGNFWTVPKSLLLSDGYTRYGSARTKECQIFRHLLRTIALRLYSPIFAISRQ